MIMQLLSRANSTAAEKQGAQAQARPRNLGKTLTIVAFLLPSTLLYFGLVILPIFQASYYSLFRWNGLVPLDNFIGLDNYAQALHDTVFVRAVGNNVMIAVLSALVQLPLALALALLIRRGMHGRTVFRLIFFLPFVISEVVTGVLWNFIYEPQTGLLNHLLAIIPGFKPL